MDKQATKSGVTRDWQNKLTGCQFVFAGMNNIIDPTNLNLEEGQVIDGLNVNFDNTSSVMRRTGYEKIYSGSFHSAWSTDTLNVAYMVSNSWIFEFDGVSNPYAIIQVSNNDPMEFCQVNDTIAYSNGTDFGLIGGQGGSVRGYSPEFKTATSGGRCLEFYNGRLYMAKGNALICTDTFNVGAVDVRFSNVAAFPYTITMCKRVEDGLWIGTEKYLYFLRGDDIRESGFTQEIISKIGVVYGTAVRVNSEWVPESQENHTIVLFLTTAGICSGGMGGKFFNHSWKEMSFEVGPKGTAIFRTEHGISQYVVCFDMDVNYEYNPYSTDIKYDINVI